ncbi:site-specific integrase [Calothrix sp. PCC 7507]|uniref:tyrosine-type recombinase/integrase n=1 Tax=Calothrix sp. PCC 7507 TaxID=99598 RepID=UPI00029EC929|nr:site-specific integrase [Calothrix sp. PCC 7507]AFY34879.1 integrase family protein [Calothrix sp. PCC 7507]
MKNNRNGQSAVITDTDYSKIRKQIKSRKYKLLLDLAWYTGERWGALVQLQVDDVYDAEGKPREFINFRARTRKATPDGKRKTRQVPVHPVLRESLLGYQPEAGAWMFPDREGDQAISLRWGDMILRCAVDKAGLSAKGISTHSTRRSFITKLAKRGVSLATIKKATGHTDLKVLSRYIEVTDDDVKEAIATL